VTKLGALNCHNGLTSSCHVNLTFHEFMCLHHGCIQNAFQAKIPGNRRNPGIGSRLGQSVSILEQQLSFFTVSAAHVEAKLASPTACPDGSQTQPAKIPQQEEKILETKTKVSFPGRCGMTIPSSNALAPQLQMQIKSTPHRSATAFQVALPLLIGPADLVSKMGEDRDRKKNLYKWSRDGRHNCPALYSALYIETVLSPAARSQKFAPSFLRRRSHTFCCSQFHKSPTQKPTQQSID